MYQFESTKIFEIENVSENFKKHVKKMFEIGGNNSFQLADVAEWAEDKILLDEINLISSKYGDELILKREQWLS